tara:strand:- start:204476 stop:205357 length:882 start_codon:yes stop_codon:yes gene_type:complete
MTETMETLRVLAQEWIIAHSLAIVTIILLVVGMRIFNAFVLDKLVRKIIPSNHFHSAQAEKQREDTLIRIARGTLSGLVWVLAALMILSEMGVNIGPLLAAAGVAGLAIGFGGQYLIRDIVAGIFIILENHYRVGDVVCLDDVCGVVEDVSIRMTTLRDLDGTVHNIPHGTVQRSANKSKDFARVNMNIGISYDADLDQVIEVINRVGAELALDPLWENDILKAIKFERVDKFGDSTIDMKVLGDTKPLRQWAVAGEFRMRLRKAFAKEGIDLPFPQMVVHTPGLSEMKAKKS